MKSLRNPREPPFEALIPRLLPHGLGQDHDGYWQLPGRGDSCPPLYCTVLYCTVLYCTGDGRAPRQPQRPHPPGGLDHPQTRGHALPRRGDDAMDSTRADNEPSPRFHSTRRRTLVVFAAVSHCHNMCPLLLMVFAALSKLHVYLPCLGARLASQMFVVNSRQLSAARVLCTTRAWWWSGPAASPCSRSSPPPAR